MFVDLHNVPPNNLKKLCGDTSRPVFHSFRTLRIRSETIVNKTCKTLPATHACNSGPEFGNLAAEQCTESALLVSLETCESRPLATLPAYSSGFPETHGRPYPGPSLTECGHWSRVGLAAAETAQGYHKAPVTVNKRNITHPIPSRVNGEDIMSCSLLSLWMKSLSVTIQMKATEQYFRVVPSILLYNVVLTFRSVHKRRWCTNLSEISSKIT